MEAAAPRRAFAPHDGFQLLIFHFAFCILHFAFIRSSMVNSNANRRAELAGREFLPTVQRIKHISGTSEPCEWQVETDRGPTRFVLKSEDDVRRVAPHRAIITDADGVRYLVSDSRRLDAFSQRMMERYV